MCLKKDQGREAKQEAKDIPVRDFLQAELLAKVVGYTRLSQDVSILLPKEHVPLIVRRDGVSHRVKVLEDVVGDDGVDLLQGLVDARVVAREHELGKVDADVAGSEEEKEGVSLMLADVASGT